MKSIGSKDCIDLLRYLADEIESKKAMLGELDSVVGDGDFGITMGLGFSAIRVVAVEWDGKSIAEMLVECSDCFSTNAPSTIGTLFATGFQAASSVVTGKDTVGGQDVYAMLDAATQAIQKRGKANLGEKTILDALAPAVRSAQGQELAEVDLERLMESLAAAAEQGAEATRNLKATKGRARWLQDRSIGNLDPGAVAAATILRACANYLRDHR